MDVNASIASAGLLRLVVPRDLTHPHELGNLVIVGNYKSIMISFNPSNDSDLSGYLYEVFLPESIAQQGSSYTPIGEPFLSGFSSANVIALDVPQNSTSISQVNSNTGQVTEQTEEKIYFARVRSIDTSNNLSLWTSIVASSATTLIDSAHIRNLTASKITAGTIGAHTITMAGATSIIKSSNFDGTHVGNGSYSNATTGWLINGQGRAYFYDATIVGSIDIGGFDSGSFHVDIDGNMWLGAGVFADGTFRVTKEGDAYANSLTTNNLDLQGSTELSNDGKIFLGAGNYNNDDTPFYVDSDSLFSLGTKLTWNGTTLTVRGNLKLADGTDAINQDDADDAAEEAVNEFENAIYQDGFIGGLTINSTQMYYGAGNFGNSNTAFYVAKNAGSGQADFSLGNKLSWDGTTLAITGSVTANTGKIGSWEIDEGGRLVSDADNEDPQVILSPTENGGTGAIKLGDILIGNNDLVTGSAEVTSDSEAVYYSGASQAYGLGDPGYSFAFVYRASQGKLYAIIYGANGVEKEYCITECGTSIGTSSTSTSTTNTPGGTTTSTPGTTATLAPTTTTTLNPNCPIDCNNPGAGGWVLLLSDASCDYYAKEGCGSKCCPKNPGGGGGGGGSETTTTTTTTTTAAPGGGSGTTTTTTAAPGGGSGTTTTTTESPPLCCGYECPSTCENCLCGPF